MKDSAFDHTGSSLEKFLRSEGILKEVDKSARERVQAWLESLNKISLHVAAEALQRETCGKQGAQFLAVSADNKLGFATSTRGKIPINGLRHPPEGDTCGWYVWCGEEISYADDFFAPIHVRHMYEDFPEITRFLGLPPGYRFLIAGEYVDVWFDPSLLNA